MRIIIGVATLLAVLIMWSIALINWQVAIPVIVLGAFAVWGAKRMEWL